MRNKRKDSIKFLKKLENIFPEDSLMARKTPILKDFDIEVVENLLKHKLIEEIKYGVIGLPDGEKVKIPGYTLTLQGIEFLNGLKQKRTNLWLIILTVLMAIIGVVQTFILLK